MQVLLANSTYDQILQRKERKIFAALLMQCQVLILSHASSFIKYLFPSKAEDVPG